MGLLLKVVKYDYNDIQDKLNALKIIKKLITEGRIRQNCNVVMDLVDMGIVGILCHIIVKFGNRPCLVPFLEVLMLVLKEEEEEIQDRVYTFLS